MGYRLLTFPDTPGDDPPKRSELHRLLYNVKLAGVVLKTVSFAGPALLHGTFERTPSRKWPRTSTTSSTRAYDLMDRWD